MTERDKLLASAAVPFEPEGAAEAGHDDGRSTNGAPEPLYVPFARARHISGLSKSTLYREAMAGRLRLVKCGRRTLVHFGSLRALLDGLPAAQLKNAA